MYVEYHDQVYQEIDSLTWSQSLVSIPNIQSQYLLS